MNELDEEGLSFRPDQARRENFFSAESNADRLLAMLSAATAELAVLRARLDTHERLSAARGGFGRADVESFAPSAEVMAERQADCQDIIRRVFEPLSAELGAQAEDPATPAALAQRVAAAGRS
jgi:hypothetical protein